MRTLIAVLCLSASAFAQAVLTIPGMHADLASALAASQAGDRIEIAPGTYSGPGWRNLDLSNRALEIVGTGGAAATTIDLLGAPANPARFLAMGGGPTLVTLRGLTIRNGDASGDGGAFLIQGGARLTAQDCVVRQCRSPFEGGALKFDGFGIVTLERTRFEFCSADLGGVIAQRGQGRLIARDCEFLNSTSQREAGAHYQFGARSSFERCRFDGQSVGPFRWAGIVLVEVQARCELLQCELLNGTAQSGGAITVFDSELVLRGGRFQGHRASQGLGGAIDAVNSRLTIEDALFEDNRSLASEGGALSLQQCTTVIRRTTFRGNLADFNGGAIRLRVGPSTLIDACSFEDNTTLNAGGAGICASDGVSAQIVGCTFLRNAAESDGGGIQALSNSNLTITGGRFEANRAVQFLGGAISIYDAGTQVAVSGASFLRNTAAEGGAIQAWDGTALTLDACAFEGNQAAARGGALLIHGAGSSLVMRGGSLVGNTATFHAGAADLRFGANASLEGVLIRGNSALTNWFGAVYCDQADTVRFVRCTVTENVSPGNAGAIGGSRGTIFLEGCLIAANLQSFAAVRFEEATVWLSNTTITDNGWGGLAVFGSGPPAALLAANSIIHGNFPSFDNLLVSGAAATIFACNIENAGPWTGVNGNLSIDPQFASPWTGDFHLTPGSPMIDAGNNALIQPSLLRDLDGDPRVLGLGVDIGHDESGSTAFPSTSGAVQFFVTRNDDPRSNLAQVGAGDTLALQVVAAQPVAVGGLLFVAANAFQSSQPFPTPTPFPGLFLDLTSAVFLVDATAPLPLQTTVLGAQGWSTAFVVSPGLSGLALLLQAASVQPTTLSLSNGALVQFR